MPSTSGTYTFSQSASKLINGALRLCGAIADEETPTAAMAENALDSFNAMVKGWQATGIHVWAEQECILFPQAEQIRYQLGSGSTDKACLFENFTQTALTATAAAGATSISVSSIVGLATGDQIGVQLDSGVNFWTTINGAPSGSTVTLLAGLTSQATSGAVVLSYDVPLMRPLRMPAARRMLYSTGIQTPLIVMSRLDYDYLPNPSNAGIITQFFYDPQTGNGAYSSPMGILNVWPAPQDYTNAFRFVAMRPLQDVSNLTQMPDFPAEWLAALRWNLAMELAPEYDVPAERIAVLKGQADMWFARVKEWDREPESYLFGVAAQPAYRT